MKKISLFLSIILFSSGILCAAEKSRYEKIHLWKDVGGMEYCLRDTILYSPKYAEQPEQNEAKKTAVVICPGGSYHHLGLPHEGFTSSKWFDSIGVVPFVLQYRVAYNCHHHPAMLEDIQMAIKYIRENARKYGIDKNKIGAIGFSAGGHLVTMAGVYGGTRNELAKHGISTAESLRPNFVMPIYPVVSMQDDIAHKWSRISLLGHQFKNGAKGFSLANMWGHTYTKEMKDEYSMELNIPSDMVPSYIVACRDDPVVKFENSVRLDRAMTEKNIPHEFAVYEKGGHGFGMKDGWFMEETHWNEKLKAWMLNIGMLEEAE